VQKILFLTADLEYRGPVTQLTLLARRLPRDRFLPRVCTLGDSGPAAEPLRSAGVPVEALGWRRPFDVNPALALRRLLREFRPDVIHAWGLTPARAVWLASRPDTSRLVVGDALDARLPAALVRRLDRWLLPRAAHLIATGEVEAERYRRYGRGSERIRVIPPGVEIKEGSQLRPPTAAWGLPEGTRYLAGVGPFLPHRGHRDAIWAFDILRYLYNDLYLVLIGEGPHRPRLDEFARGVQTGDGLKFVGPQPEVTPLLACAEAVWVTNRAGEGVNVALEAMAAGRPVVAYRRPPVVEVVVEGETGFLVDPGDKAALARQTRVLLDDADLGRQLGEAGRRRAAAAFPADVMVRRYADVYATTG
jgi:glycosyltransferase involved in cell wall biosynthesis